MPIQFSFKTPKMSNSILNTGYPSLFQSTPRRWFHNVRSTFSRPTRDPRTQPECESLFPSLVMEHEKNGSNRNHRYSIKMTKEFCSKSDCHVELKPEVTSVSIASRDGRLIKKNRGIVARNINQFKFLLWLFISAHLVRYRTM